MSHPDLSLPASSVCDQFSELASTVCRNEHSGMTTKDNGLTYNWLPADWQVFETPLELSGISWTSHPQWNHNFQVIQATFGILGDDESSLSVARNYASTADFDHTLNSDPLADFVLQIFKKSYEGHRHADCLAEIKAVQTPAQKEPGEPFKITDSRGSKGDYDPSYAAFPSWNRQ